MRIVASQASYSRIVCVMSPAVENAIRLKANIVDSRLPGKQHRLLKAGMAGATKRLRELMGGKTSWIVNH